MERQAFYFLDDLSRHTQLALRHLLRDPALRERKLAIYLSPERFARVRLLVYSVLSNRPAAGFL